MEYGICMPGMYAKCVSVSWILVAARSKPVLNFCAKNYLGLSSHPALVQASEVVLKFVSHDRHVYILHT